MWVSEVICRGKSTRENDIRRETNPRECVSGRRVSRAAPRFCSSGLVFGVSAIYRETQRPRRTTTSGDNFMPVTGAGNKNAKEGATNRELRALPFLPTEASLSYFYHHAACQRGILRQKGDYLFSSSSFIFEYLQNINIDKIVVISGKLCYWENNKRRREVLYRFEFMIFIC